MTLKQKTGRRRFLSCSVASIISLGGSFEIIRIRHGDRDEIEIAKKLASLFATEESALLVGSEFLQSYSEEVSLEGIVRRLFPSPETRRLYAKAGDSEYRQYLADKCARDFEEHLTVSVDGWILAESEALTCAAAFLVYAS